MRRKEDKRAEGGKRGRGERKEGKERGEKEGSNGNYLIKNNKLSQN